MYASQFKGCQMGQSSGVLLKEVAAFRTCLFESKPRSIDSILAKA